MGAVSGVLGGVLALSTLQLVLSSKSGTSAYGALVTGPAGWLEKFMDPTAPLIPDHSVTAPASSSSSGSSTSSSSIPAPSSLPPAAATSTLNV